MHKLKFKRAKKTAEQQQSITQANLHGEHIATFIDLKVYLFGKARTSYRPWAWLVTTTSIIHYQDIHRKEVHNPQLLHICVAPSKDPKPSIHLEERYLHNQKEWPSPTFLRGIRNTGIAKEVIRHFPAPVLFPRHRHSGPSVYPNIVLPDCPIPDKTSYNWKTAFMAAPYPITRIRSLASILMKVATHGRTSAFPVGIKISPIFWSHLRPFWLYVKHSWQWIATGL